VVPRSVTAAWLAALVVVVGLAGCGPQSTAPDALKVLQTSLAELASARSVILDGTVTMQKVTYQVTLNEDGNSGAEGSVNVTQKPVGVIWSGGRLLLRRADYFDAQQVYTGDRWVLVQDDKLVTLVGALAKRKDLVASLSALAGTHVSQRAGAPIQGVPTIQLVSDTLTATVPAAGGAPLRIATALDQQLSDGLADLKLSVLASNSALTVSPPPAFVDLANRNSLPAQFVDVTGGPADNFHFDSCDARGCTLSDLFRNTGGRLGTSHATFAAQRGDVVVDSCSVDIPTVDNGETVRAGCRVKWDYYNTQVTGEVRIMNPD
jgi:hypothetical protein